MSLGPITLSHGERYGKLTVLRKIKSHGGWQYRCGCECGNSKTIVTAKKLMKDKVRACANCRNSTSANSTQRNS